jgi:hypothetical protein
MRQEAGKRDDPPAVGIDSTKLDKIAIRCGPASETDPLQLGIDRIRATAPFEAQARLDADISASADRKCQWLDRPEGGRDRSTALAAGEAGKIPERVHAGQNNRHFR